METSTTTAQPPAYRYSAPWPVYALAWSSHGSQSSIGGARLALGSFVEEYRNMLQVVEVGGADSAAMTVVAEEKHSYPITKVQWVPRKVRRA